MARLPRLAVGGLPHLVRLVGRPGQAVFRDDQDRQQFLAALRESALQHGVAVHAYSLLDAEVRLLLTPPTASALGQLMQGLGRRYVAGFNRRHGHSGALWAGRYRASVVQPGPLVCAAMLGVDTLALRSGQVTDAAQHPWSSTRHHLGLVRDPVVTVGQAYWALGNTPFEREAAYRKLLDAGPDSVLMRQLDEAAHKGWAVGDAGFLAELAQDLHRPVMPRRRGRPRGVTTSSRV